MTEKTDKQRLEEAVSGIGKALVKAIRCVEDSKELTVEQVDFAFGHISHLLLTARQKAALSVSIANAANGAFSLDKIIEVNLQPMPVYPQGVPFYPPGARPAPPERIVGAGRKRPRDDDDEPGVGFLGSGGSFGDDDFSDF